MGTQSINVGLPTEAQSFGTINEVLNILPNNTAQLITPRDVRDAIYTLHVSQLVTTTSVSSSSVDYTGYHDVDLKQKIFFGKKELSGQEILNSALLTGDTDLFIYNNKADSNPSLQNTKIRILGGSDASLFPTAPYIETQKITSPNRLDLEVGNSSGAVRLDGNIIEILSDTTILVQGGGELTMSVDSITASVSNSVYVSSVNLITLDSTTIYLEGNVGIGITPTEKLDVSGNVKADIFKVSNHLEITGFAASSDKVIELGSYDLYADNVGTGFANTRVWWDAPDGGEMIIGPRSGSVYLDNLRFKSRSVLFENGTFSMILDNTALNVGGTIILSDSGNTTDGAMRWSGSDFEGRKSGVWTSLTSTGPTNSSPGGSSGQVQYNSAGLFAGDSNFVWNDSTKRLGIGIAPTEKLHINAANLGNISNGPGGASAEKVYLGIDTASQSISYNLGINDGTRGTRAKFFLSDGSVASPSGTRAWGMWETWASGGQGPFVIGMATEKFRIDTNGYVGIGTQTPSEKLHVNGAVIIGNAVGTTLGTIRYVGTPTNNLQGRVSVPGIGQVWRSLSEVAIGAFGDIQYSKDGTGVFKGTSNFNWDETRLKLEYNIQQPTTPFGGRVVLDVLNAGTSTANWDEATSVSIRRESNTIFINSGNTHSIANLNFIGPNSTSGTASVYYGQIRTITPDTTAGSEYSTMEHYVMNNGSQTRILAIKPGGIAGASGSNIKFVPEDGNSIFASNDGLEPTITIQRDILATASNAEIGEIRWMNTDTFPTKKVAAIKATLLTAGGSSQHGRLEFQTNNSGFAGGFPATRMTISENGNIGINRDPAANKLEINGRIFLADISEPSTPSGGGVIYVQSGALKYKGSSGTVTTLGIA